MEVTRFSETSTNIRTTRRYILEDGNFDHKLRLTVSYKCQYVSMAAWVSPKFIQCAQTHEAHSSCTYCREW
jgi:hypothetical protein